MDKKALRAELKAVCHERDEARHRVEELEQQIADSDRLMFAEEIAALHREVKEARDQAELQQLKAVEAARQEARSQEQLLESVIKDLRQQMKDSRHGSAHTGPSESSGHDSVEGDASEDAETPVESGGGTRDSSSVLTDAETKTDTLLSTSWIPRIYQYWESSRERRQTMTRRLKAAGADG